MNFLTESKARVYSLGTGLTAVAHAQATDAPTGKPATTLLRSAWML